MRQVTAQEKYRAVNEGVMAEAEFVRQMKLAFPQFVSPANTYPDTVQILKNYNLINEDKKEVDDTFLYSDDSLRRAIDIELEAMGLMSQETISGEDHSKAKKKAIANLKKDPLHYYNLIAKESSKVDKHDKPKEVKRGAADKDTFNDMKKAVLKESTQEQSVADYIIKHFTNPKTGTSFVDDDMVSDFYKTHPEWEEMADGTEEGMKDLIFAFNEFLNANFDSVDEKVANTVDDVIDPADYGLIGQGYLKGFNKPHSLNADDLETLGRKVVDSLYKGDFDKAKAKFVNEADRDEESMVHELIGDLFAPGNARYHLDLSVKEIARGLKRYGDHLTKQGVKDAMDLYDKLAADGTLDKEVEEGNGFVSSKHVPKLKKAFELIGLYGKGINESVVKKNIKSIITKILEEEVINEAATNDLAKIAEDYGDFEGLKPAIIALQNIVTEIESFYDKTRGKIQKIYTDLGEVRNEEGLKVGAFIAPSIENAFKRDLRPITKQQFHGGLEMPKVKRISESDPVMRKPDVTQMEAPKETVFTPVNEKKK